MRCACSRTPILFMLRNRRLLEWPRSSCASTAARRPNTAWCVMERPPQYEELSRACEHPAPYTRRIPGLPGSAKRRPVFCYRGWRSTHNKKPNVGRYWRATAPPPSPPRSPSGPSRGLLPRPALRFFFCWKDFPGTRSSVPPGREGGGLKRGVKLTECVQISCVMRFRPALSAFSFSFRTACRLEAALPGLVVLTSYAMTESLPICSSALHAAPGARPPLLPRRKKCVGSSLLATQRGPQAPLWVAVGGWQCAGRGSGTKKT